MCWAKGNIAFDKGGGEGGRTDVLRPKLPLSSAGAGTFGTKWHSPVAVNPLPVANARVPPAKLHLGISSSSLLALLCTATHVEYAHPAPNMLGWNISHVTALRTMRIHQSKRSLDCGAVLKHQRSLYFLGNWLGWVYLFQFILCLW